LTNNPKRATFKFDQNIKFMANLSKTTLLIATKTNLYEVNWSSEICKLVQLSTNSVFKKVSGTTNFDIFILSNSGVLSMLKKTKGRKG